MKNKNARQLSLPLEIVQSDLSPTYLDIIKQNWQVTFSKQYMTSVFTKRVMGLIAAQIQEDGKVQEYYQIHASKIIQEVDMVKAEVYRKMKEVMYELSTVTFYFEDPETGTIIPRHLLDTTRFENPSGYYNGILTVAFNPRLEGVVNELSHFSNYELNRYTNFSSWYSMRLYEILYAFKEMQEVEFYIESYRDWMGCGAKINPKTGKLQVNKKTGKFVYIKYASHSDMILKTTLEPIKDFKNTDLAFKVEPVYAKVGKGRRPIQKIKFKFINKRQDIKQLIKDWRLKSDDFSKIYLRLKKYEVSDKNIVKYAQVIGKKRFGKLLVQWDQKNASKEPINNPKIYCNKVIRTEGEDLIEKKLNSI